MFQVKTIVPGKFAVAGQPAPQDLLTVAEQGYRTLISNRPDSEAESQPSAEVMRASAATHGLDYVHIPVTLGSISRRDIDAFQEAVESAPKPVLAHCGSGKRAFLLWAAGEVLYHNRPADELVEQAASVAAACETERTVPAAHLPRESLCSRFRGLTPPRLWGLGEGGSPRPTA